MADDSLARPPLRSNPGAAAGPPPRGRLGHDRRQSGQGRCRQPDTASKGAASVRILGGARSNCAALGSRYGPMIIFAAATGLRPAEWIALEKRDINFEERVVYV